MERLKALFRQTEFHALLFCGSLLLALFGGVVVLLAVQRRTRL